MKTLGIIGVKLFTIPLPLITRAYRRLLGLLPSTVLMFSACSIVGLTVIYSYRAQNFLLSQTNSRHIVMDHQGNVRIWTLIIALHHNITW